jgi:two-component system nitrogen regulation response regulator GlnG
MPVLLIVDDESSVRYTFRRLFASDEREVVTAGTVAEGLALWHEKRPDVVVLDLQLPDGTGLAVLDEIRASNKKTPVIFITAHGTATTAIEAMKNGAFDYVVKPVDYEALSELLERAFAAVRLMAVPVVTPTIEPVQQIVGSSAVMQEMCKGIGRIAPQNVNVLIRGESGTGKELVARAIYRYSPRADRSFLAVNCAALPEALVESELFGHEEGAFTGAGRKRIGKFEQCDGGTLFLDEIGDLPLQAQAKMLRILQEQAFERVGGKETIHTDVRILAATNQDLEQLVAAGKFRKDLYYRLKVVTIQIPALRERGADIDELAHYFLAINNRELGLGIRAIDSESLAMLQQYAWPGNVRELQSVLKEAMLRTTGAVLLPEFLTASFQETTRSGVPEPDSQKTNLEQMVDDLLGRGEVGIYATVMRDVERFLFQRVLRHTNGHQTQASGLLGLNRTTLRYKLRELGLSLGKGMQDAAPDDAERSL